MTRFALISIALVMTGCAAVQKGGTLATSTVAGAAIGGVATGGNPIGIGGGAVGGLAVGAGLNAIGDSRVRAAAQEAYQKGQSDSIKQHYWMLQAQQERTRGDANGVQHYYDVTIPPGVDSYGVRRTPSRVTLPIVE
ncbi:MAG: hypothetical protein V4710_14365 [Verrucomicrobiota bacterium]